MDYDIPQNIEKFIQDTGQQPNSLLLTENHYKTLIKNLGIKEQDDLGERIFKTLYGLDLIFTKTPITTPRILKITN